jgi:hypothetical protein
MANLAANTDIINSAKLTYTGGTESATVSVTVALVPAQPNVSITNSTGAYTAPNTPALTDSVVITSAANGPVDYTVTPSVVAGAGTANSDAPSVTAVSSGNNAAVNGIGVTDTIVFTVGGNTTTKQVTSTTDNGDGTFRLNWTGAIPDAAVPAAGVQVGEQATVTLSVLPGTVSTSGTDITVTVQAVVTTNGAADATATNSTPNTWTTPSSPSVSMDKYVRNITTTAYNPAVGGTPFTINGADRDYFTAGVTGKTGDTLEYVIVASSLAGGADLTGCAISDLIPEAFVTLKIGVYGVNNVFYIAPDGATSSYTAGAVGIQQASFVAGSNPNLIVNVGDGASNTLTGTIPVGQSVTIAYQVTIK